MPPLSRPDASQAWAEDSSANAIAFSVTPFCGYSTVGFDPLLILILKQNGAFHDAGPTSWNGAAPKWAGQSHRNLTVQFGKQLAQRFRRRDIEGSDLQTDASTGRERTSR